MALALRQSVREFAEAMERKLRKHDKARGSDGWRNEGWEYLWSRATEEMCELRAACLKGHRAKVRGETADVGNFMMMLFENSDVL